MDEIWSFVYAKAKNVPADKQGVFGVGDVWTFTALCAETKLVPGFVVGCGTRGPPRSSCRTSGTGWRARACSSPRTGIGGT